MSASGTAVPALRHGCAEAGAGAKILYLERPDVPLDRSLTAVCCPERKIDSVPAMGVGQLRVWTRSTRPSIRRGRPVLDEALAAGYPTVRLSGEASTVWTVTSPRSTSG